MEGKSVLFKRFADIDSIDNEIVNIGANSIKTDYKKYWWNIRWNKPWRYCCSRLFYYWQKLKETLDIPVFHDDQHGTAIITTAALINALDISKKKISDVKVVVNGAGASAQACAIIQSSGVKSENIIMCDSKVIYKGRKNIDQFKSAFATDTKSEYECWCISWFIS